MTQTAQAEEPEDLDLSWLPTNYQKALKIKAADAKNINLPTPPGWNTEFQPKTFQRKGAAWMLMARRGILADQVGLGKTIETLLMVMSLKARGYAYRTVVLTTKSTQQQWLNESRKFTNLRVTAPRGTKAERITQYQSQWELLVTTYPLILRDAEYLVNYPFNILVCDEGSYFRHHDIKTKGVVEHLARGRLYILVLDATPIQTSLLDIHSLFEVLHMNIFGAVPMFEHRYIRREKVKQKRGNPFLPTSRIIGYKNMAEFKTRVTPFMLRRRAQDDEVEEDLPEILTIERYVDLLPEQRRQYSGARQGIVTLWEQGQRVQARAHFHHMLQACASTWAFNDPHPSSSKIDWIIDQMRPPKNGEFGGDLWQEKVVVFARYKATIAHIMQALTQLGVRGYRYTGEEDDIQRSEAVREFWEDPSVKYIVGTSALERGLNLQKSAYMIAVDQLFNPRRMEQLVGRLRRLGSEHAKVRLINMIAADTVEERLYGLQAERAAVQDYVFGETSEMFEQLSDAEFYSLIQE